MGADAAAAFHAAMIRICERAKAEIDYNPARFHQMVAEIGGVETARRLLRTATPSEGLWTLAQAGRLDLSMESQVLADEYASLFTDDERRVAQDRLDDLGGASRRRRTR